MKSFKKTYALITALLIGACSSCSDISLGDKFLEKAPGVDITLDTIFSSKLYADRALLSAYTSLRYGLVGPNKSISEFPLVQMGNKLGWDVLESLTDINQTFCTWGGVDGLYYNGQYNASTEESSSSTKYGYDPKREFSWTGIRQAYVYIENVDRVPDMTDAEKKQRKAEAKMIIACHYHEMLRHFGGMPIIDHAATPNEANVYPRATLEETVNHIITLITEAAPDLPWQVTADEDGRFCAAGALGLKIRVLLLAASPVFNDDKPYMDGEASTKKMTWYGNKDPQRWNDVITACEDFIKENQSNGNLFKLVDTGNPREDFSNAYWKRHNNEILIATCRFRHDFTSYWWSDLYHSQYLGNYGGGAVTLDYVNKFEFVDGTPFDWDNPQHANDPFTNRDPRLYETVLVNDDYFQGRKAQLYIGGEERGPVNEVKCKTGFGTRKFLWERDDATLTGRVVNYPYLRLPEIYLSYAEALNETGRTAEAYSWINKVRNRVDLPDLPVTFTRETLRDEILDERAREFAFEEIRWFDLVRWKREDIFKQDLHGLYIYNTGKENGKNSYTYEPWILPARYWKKNWSPKWYFSAFPPNEINKKYGLIQNPGW